MSLHSVEIYDAGSDRTPVVLLDGFRVRGVIGLDVSKQLGQSAEVTIRILAAGLNDPNQEVYVRPYISPPAPETETPAHQSE